MTSEEKKTRVLIIGAGDHGDVIVSRILKGYSNLKIVAIIDDDLKIGQRCMACPSKWTFTRNFRF